MTTRWHARVSATGRYHRVEVEGAGIGADPIAVVKEKPHAVAIAALPRVAAALKDARELLGRCECMPTGVVRDQADEAIAEMEGRDAPPW